MVLLCKLHVPVVTLSAKDNQKLSKMLSKVCERSIYWNERKTKSEKALFALQKIKFRILHFQIS